MRTSRESSLLLSSAAAASAAAAVVPIWCFIGHAAQTHLVSSLYIIQSAYSIPCVPLAVCACVFNMEHKSLSAVVRVCVYSFLDRDLGL